MSNTWHSVESDLPERGVRVLVWRSGTVDVAWIGNYGAGDVWSNDNWHRDVTFAERYITHWMPLPDAPPKP